MQHSVCKFLSYIIIIKAICSENYSWIQIRIPLCLTKFRPEKLTKARDRKPKKVLSFIFCWILSIYPIISLKVITQPTAEILSGKNARAFLVCGLLMKSFKKILKILKKSWEPFGSYLQNSTANPAHFHSNWAGLAMLFSR